jgi:LmbE family N-acetylglucosaminyl deacetylase/uncharacterized coiled-coil protein SlyX/GT2 family glycosyltransferase
LENLLVPYQAVTKIPAKQVLVLAPHPDDEVFGCGGAIIRHVEEGIPVHVIVLSDGAYGVDDDKVADYTQQRQNESIDAANVLGYGVPVFWQYRDREICYGEKLVQEILTAINKTQADLIYAPSVFEMHPDHRALGIATIEAVRRVGNATRLALYEVGIPLHPNQLLDISDLTERKQKAMACFVSQNEKQRYDLDIAALNRYRTYTLPADVTAAEAYILVAAEELANDPLKLFESEHARQKSLGLALDSRDLPLVSVIIRSMDRATLSDALDSVALQTYPNIEVVVVNAKGMNHRDIGTWCGRFPMRLVGESASLTRSRAANTGLEAAKGKYLIFLDDDDWFLPHHIHTLKAEFDHADTAIAVYSAVQSINAQCEEIRRFEEDFDPIQLHIDNFIPIHAVLFRRQAIDNGARFDESLTICEDWDFWLQVQKYGEFRFVAKVGAVYQMQNSMRSGVWDNPEQTRQVMTVIYRKWIPQWSDKMLWSILEYARYKRLHTELNKATNVQIKTLNTSIMERDARIAELGTVIAERGTRMTELGTVIAERDGRIAELGTVIAERGAVIAERGTRIAELGAVIAERDARITELDTQVTTLNKRIAEFLSSTSWRITRPIRTIRSFFQNRRLSDDH